jgi:hypothetical protein
MKRINHRDDRAILIEHTVHRVADINENAFREALNGTREIVFESQIGAARGEPQVSRMHKRSAPLREKFVEPAKDGVAGHTDESQPIFLVGECADAVGSFVGHLFHEVAEKMRAFCRPAKAIRHAEINRSVRERIKK